MSRNKNPDRKPFRNIKPPAPLFLSCNKCGHIITESRIAQHIQECQGGKAECAKCHRFIEAEDFLEHFKKCEGRKL